MNIESVLREFGLTDFEIRVYLTLNEIGRSGAGAIIRKSRLHRGTAYNVLDRLIEKGLVGYAIKNGVKLFEASEPESLLNILKERENSVSKIIPELKRIKKTEIDIQSASLFEGVNGLKTALNIFLNTFKSGDKMYVFGSSPASDYMIDFWKVYDRRRERKGVKMDIIYMERSEKQFQHLLRLPMTRLRILEKPYFSAMDVQVGNDSIVLAIYAGKPVCFVVRNREAADSFKRYFNVLWKIARPVNK